MSKFKIEIPIILIAVFIGAVVVTMGYLSYRILSKIVNSIHQETVPDNNIYYLKNIASDLLVSEHMARLYMLTNNYSDLESFYSIEDTIKENINDLRNLNSLSSKDRILIDSFSELSREKLGLWNEIIETHLRKPGIFPAFSGLFTELNKPLPDSTFSANNGVETSIPVDSNGVNFIEKSDISRKLQSLEWKIYKSQAKQNAIESKLIEKNIALGNKINLVIKDAEKDLELKLSAKKSETDHLAGITYKRLLLYTVSGIALMFVAIFMLFNYLRKSRVTHRILTEANKKAEALALAKEQFAANVSHELRTPVNAIYGLTEQLIEKNPDKSISEMVEVILKSAGHLKNIVNDTLDFSKIQSKKIKLESVPFIPTEIFNDVYSLFKYEVANKGVDLILHWNGEKPDILIGDPLRLKQIIINIVGNAIKFTDNGSVKINIKGIRKKDRLYELLISVIDTGIGIDEKNLNQVFDEFVQIGNVDGKKYYGTGLGLSIVKKLVELHEGNLKIESEPGKGTTVNINLVLQEGETSYFKKETNSVPGIPYWFSNLSIIIADDEEFNRFLMKNILQKWGAWFKVTNNGKEVINAVCNEHFDLILLDLNMPGMNGIEAAGEIRKCNSDVKIIAVTAQSDQLDKNACFKAGINEILLKPFSEKDLIAIIEDVIKMPSGANIIANGNGRPDISELSRLTGGDNHFLVEMIQIFIESMESGLSGIERAMEKEKWNEVSELAHKLAAPVKHFNANQLYEEIRNLERISKSTSPGTDIKPAFKIIKDEADNLILVLKSYLEKLNF